MFGNTYYKMLTAINNMCDPNCSSDPYFHNYVLMYEPPLGRAPMSVSARVAGLPGLVDGVQHRMTAEVARARVFESLVSAGIDQDKTSWEPIRGRVAGAAYEVHAFFPSGAPWSYYLVPLMAGPNAVQGFVQLSAADGSFQSVYPFAGAVSFAPVSHEKARELATDLLHDGETLSGGGLTWDARTITSFAKSPIRPYYEYTISSGSLPGKSLGSVRIALDGGMTARTR